MLERDYIMRLIRQFFEALKKLIESRNEKEPATIQAEFGQMYTAYFGKPDTFFYGRSADEILNFLRETYNPQEFLSRVEMLADLIYYHGTIKTEETERKMFFRKSLALLEYLDAHSDTFSFERRRKISDIRKQTDQ